MPRPMYIDCVHHAAAEAVSWWVRSRTERERELLLRGTAYDRWRAAVAAGVVTQGAMDEAARRAGELWHYTGD